MTQSILTEEAGLMTSDLIVATVRVLKKAPWHRPQARQLLPENAQTVPGNAEETCL